MLGWFALSLLAADVGGLIESEAYEQAYKATRPKGVEGAAWIGFLYEAELLDVVRFGRAAEGVKSSNNVGWHLRLRRSVNVSCKPSCSLAP